MSVSKVNSDDQLCAPDIPESTQPEQLIEILPDTPVERDAANQVVLQALKGVVLLSNPDNLFLGGWSGEEGIVLGEVEIPGDQTALIAELNEFLGRAVTFRDLVEIRRLVERWFIQHDLPVIQVIAPPGQDITSGVVQYAVVTGHMGEMRVEGAEYNDPTWLISQMGVEPGEQLSSRAINQQLDWLNRNPFREVNALLGPGEEFGVTDVTLKVKDRKPRRFFARYENTGTAITGRDRWVAGFNLGNLWQRDHMFSYQYTSSFNSRHLKAHAFDYRIPLPWQHMVELSGAYVRSKPKVDSNFDQQGKSWRLGGRYIKPLSFQGRAYPTK